MYIVQYTTHKYLIYIYRDICIYSNNRIYIYICIFMHFFHCGMQHTAKCRAVVIFHSFLRFIINGFQVFSLVAGHCSMNLAVQEKCCFKHASCPNLTAFDQDCLKESFKIFKAVERWSVCFKTWSAISPCSPGTSCAPYVGFSRQLVPVVRAS